MSERAGDPREDHPPEPWRLFVALDLPERVVETIGGWQERELQRLGAERLRAVRPEAMHVTLAFLGDRSASEATSVGGVVEGLDPGPIGATLLPEPVPVPRRRPRVIALGLESPGAGGLRGRLVDRLIERIGYEPDDRPFWPHVSAFRVRGGRGKGRVPRLRALEGADGHQFGFVRVALYRSELRPEGAHYSRLAANDLPG